MPEFGQATIPGAYVDQNGNTITQEDLEGKIVVTDFVFTHCPSICPKMAQQLKRVQSEFEGNDDLKIISFSIDPVRDTIERLKWYTEKIGTNDEMWHFLRAEQNIIDQTADSLKVFQEADESAPGGINHQSRFILIDEKKEVRGYYNGVDAEDVDQLIKDLHLLL